VLLLVFSTLAERLAVQPFTIAQGLPSNTIHKIVRDSRGFLWFCTAEGLSRFDGLQFVNLGLAQGLPGRVVWDLAQTRSGELWAATSGGLARLPTSRESRMEVLYPGSDARSRVVLAVKETSDGTIWVGTEGGLYYLRKESRQPARFDAGPSPELWSEPTVTVLEEDGSGNLWFGGFAGIGRICKNGRVDRWTPRSGFASYAVASLLRDRDGTIWAGTEKGLCHMLANPEPGQVPVEGCYGHEDGLPSAYTQSILRGTSGKLWVATLEGAAYAAPGKSTPLRFTAITTRQGLSDNNIEALAEDVDGDLWLGAADDGVMKVSGDNITLFTADDGLADPNVVALFEDRKRRLYAVTRSRTELAINRFDAGRFTKIRPLFPAEAPALGRGFQQLALQDHSGAWWLATGDGLLRYASAGAAPFSRMPEVQRRPTGPDGANVFRVYEDSHGDVWWSTSSRIRNTLGRWNRASGGTEFFTEFQGLPTLRSNLPSAFVEDRNGVLWIGFESQGLARRRSDGRFEYFDPQMGWPGGRVRASYRDDKGRLWFGTSTGLWRLDDPSAVRPAFRRYTPQEGLSSSTVHSITGDRHGGIYVATGNGVDRLDPDSKVEHFSTSDGLPSGVVQAVYTDHQGNLWLATRHGVARLIPEPAREGSAAPAVLITTIKVRGADQPLSAAGEADLTGLMFGPTQDQIEFGFAALQFHSSEHLLYQYRLEGSRSTGWSAPSSSRAVNFSSLPPGSYRFEVRTALASAGIAAVRFRILPPIWATWWFLTGTMVIVSACIYGFYRYRLRLVLEREHLRMRIATDLHDDIGSSLSQIAMLSDLARRSENGDVPPGPLGEISGISRELVGTMSDIVWAVNPNNDWLSNLASRIRRFATDLLGARGIDLRFEGPAGSLDINTDAEVRRQVYLIFKEGIHNIARHSGASKVEIYLVLNGDTLFLQLTDNGKGFDPTADADGNGLPSMRKRAAHLGGKLRIVSQPGAGATLTLEARLKPRSPSILTGK
jgi:ligand-binding sensor domain-containing protein